MTDVMPYVESHYRTIADRPHRAIAGLSMGGSQTLDIAFRNLAKFAYIGVFSSGATLGGGARRGAAPAAAAAPGEAAPAAAAPAAAARTPRPDWEATHKADLDNAALKKGTRLIWLSTGVDDGLIAFPGPLSIGSRSMASARYSRRVWVRTRCLTGATIWSSSRRNCFSNSRKVVDAPEGPMSKNWP